MATVGIIIISVIVGFICFCVGFCVGATVDDVMDDEFSVPVMEAEYKRRLDRICGLETPNCSHVVRKAVRIARGEIL